MNGTMQKQRAYTIALVGQPNTGKSTVFNQLTGARQHVGNWPGKTVEKKRAVLNTRMQPFLWWIFQGRTA